MSTSSPINPYEPPRTDTSKPPNFRDQDAVELADLRLRVTELESRVGRSWHVHKNIFLRIFAVWGYLLLGYALLWAVLGTVAMVVMVVVRLVTGQWP
jgi:hypothetical protein